MVEIAFVGTGGSVATPERDNTSLAIQFGPRFILIDCPGSALTKIRKLNYDPLRLETLLVTHIHPDHIYGLPALIHGLMLEDGKIRIYGSEQTTAFCAGLLDLFGLREPKIKMRTELNVLRAGERICLGESCEVLALAVPHSPASLAYRFSLKEGDKQLLYSGDTPPHRPLIEEAAGLDYLIHDASAPQRFFERYPSLVALHTSARDLGRLAEEAGVGCLIPCHFFGELDFDLPEIEREIRQSYTGRLVVPRDYDKIVL